MATASFTSATIRPSGREIQLRFSFDSPAWAGTITADLAGGNAMEIVLPDATAIYAISVVSTTIFGDGRILDAVLSLSQPVKRGQEIDALLIAAGMLTDASGDTTPSVATSTVTNSSAFSGSGARNRVPGRSGVRGRM